MAKSKWQRLRVPPICERVISFSIPQADEMLVISYEGVHLLRLGTEINMKTGYQFTEYDIYDPDAGIARYQEKTYQVIGLHGGSPIIESLAGERLVLDTELETLSIIRDGQIDLTLVYENFSGDWAVATFSTDWRYVVLGCPYDFDFVILRREDNV